jgi:hypothetical protein
MVSPDLDRSSAPVTAQRVRPSRRKECARHGAKSAPVKARRRDPVFERFSRSLELAKASWNVLRVDKELLIFPLVSFVLTVLVAISFAVPFYFTGALERAADGGVDVVTLVLGFL